MEDFKTDFSSESVKRSTVHLISVYSIIVGPKSLRT